MGGHPHSVSGAPWVPEARFLWHRLGLAPADLDRKSREPRWGGGDSDLAVLAKPAVGSKPVGGAGHPRKTAVFRWGHKSQTSRYFVRSRRCCCDGSRRSALLRRRGFLIPRPRGQRVHAATRTLRCLIPRPRPGWRSELRWVSTRRGLQFGFEPSSLPVLAGIRPRLVATRCHLIGVWRR